MSDMKFYTKVDRYMNDLFIRGVNSQGKKFKTKVSYKPTLYITRNEEDSSHFDIFGNPVEPVKPGSMSDCRKYAQQYEDVDGFYVYHADVQYPYQWIADEFSDKIEYDKSEIRVANIDIEVAAENGFPDPDRADEEILSIVVHDSFTSKYFVFSRYEYQNDDPDVVVKVVGDEYEFLTLFLHFWSTLSPDIVTGWYIKLFDIPYLVHRITRLLGENYAKKLSPFEVINAREVTMFGKSKTVYILLGLSILDYLDLYKKFTLKVREKYTLDHIAYVELDERKLDHSEYDTYAEFYKNDWKKFVDYNIRDVGLVKRLDDKLRLIHLAIELAYTAKVNFDDVYSPVKTWDILIYNYLKNKNVVVPPSTQSEKTSAYEGAYVMEPKTQFYCWVAAVDVTSMHPHIMMGYSISPETLIEDFEMNDQLKEFRSYITPEKLLNGDVDTSCLKEHGVTMTTNHQFFRSDPNAIVAVVVGEMFDRRKRFKQLKKKYGGEGDKEKEKVYDVLQEAQKVFINSLYGAFGNKNFRYYDIRIAEAVTLTSQFIIRWIAKELNEYLSNIFGQDEYVIYSDTDSCYMTLIKVLDRAGKDISDTSWENLQSCTNVIDQFCDRLLLPYIHKRLAYLADYMGCYENKIILEREVISDRVLWTAKKRYAMRMLDDEGKRPNPPKLKIKGLEAIKSSTPEKIRDWIKDGINLILDPDSNDEDLRKFIAEKKEEFFKLSSGDVAFPKAVNGIDKYKDPVTVYKKGTPIQVRGSIIYNMLVEKHGLGKKYSLIQEGEKIRFTYLKTPNPVRENVISFFSDIPKEFDLDQYVDYNTQFEKTFLSPLKLITDKIQWSLQEPSSLEDFM